MKRLRPQLLKYHRWLGLGVGVLLLVQGLTGASLVFREQIERLIHPQTVVEPAAPRASVQALVDVVRRAHPDHQISRATFPHEADGSVIFRLDRQGAMRLVAVDPYRGAIVRDGPLAAWPTEWLFRLHEQLLAGDAGRTVVGIEGLLLLIMAITGPLVWWPGAQRLASGFRVQLNAGADRAWRSLHRAAGAAVAPLLIISATTGALMIWKEPLRDGLRLVAPVVDKPSPKVLDQPGGTFLAVDDLIARAQADYGETRLLQLRFPGGHGRVVTVFLESDISARPDGAKQIYYNAYTGEDLGHYVAGALPAGNEFVDWLFPIHTGAVGGLLARGLLLISGLSLALLSASGLWLFVSRRLRRRSRPARTPSAAAGRTL